jgi:hypothetical protein
VVVLLPSDPLPAVVMAAAATIVGKRQTTGEHLWTSVVAAALASSQHILRCRFQFAR